MKILTGLLMNLVFTSTAFAMSGAPGGGKEGGGGLLGLFLPMIVVFAIFYLLLIRPQQKQQKKFKAMLEQMQKGDQVITRGGLHGKITGLADSILTLEIAENVRVKVNKDYVGAVVGKDGAVTSTK